MDGSSIALDIFMEVDEDEKKRNIDKFHPVRYFYIDCKGKLFNGELERIRDGDKKAGGKVGLNINEFGTMLRDIKSTYGYDIEIQRDIRSCIDSLFDSTSYVARMQFVLFSLGFLLPLIIQMFFTRSAGGVVICLWMCAATTLFLFILELMQIRIVGLKDHFLSLWNLSDMALIILFTFYFLDRLSEPTKEILPLT